MCSKVLIESAIGVLLSYILVAEYEIPNVSVWFYSNQSAMAIMTLFEQVDKLKRVRTLFKNVFHLCEFN